MAFGLVFLSKNYWELVRSRSNIWESAVSILAGNLNSGLSYLTTTVCGSILSENWDLCSFTSLTQTKVNLVKFRPGHGLHSKYISRKLNLVLEIGYSRYISLGKVAHCGHCSFKESVSESVNKIVIKSCNNTFNYNCLGLNFIKLSFVWVKLKLLPHKDGIILRKVSILVSSYDKKLI